MTMYYEVALHETKADESYGKRSYDEVLRSPNFDLH